MCSHIIFTLRQVLDFLVFVWSGISSVGQKSLGGVSTVFRIVWSIVRATLYAPIASLTQKFVSASVTLSQVRFEARSHPLHKLKE